MEQELNKDLLTPFSEPAAGPPEQPAFLSHAKSWENANRLASSGRFVYRGSAVGLTGRFTLPHEFEIPVQASVCLPARGGRAEACVENFEKDQILFAKAVTSAEGRKFEGENRVRYRTTVYSRIDGLNIAGRLGVDGMEARLISRNEAGSKVPYFEFADMAEKQSFQLDGHEIEVEFALGMYNQLDTLKKLRWAYAESDRFFAKYGHLFFNHQAVGKKGGFINWLKSRLSSKFRKLPGSKGHVLCTLVRNIVSHHPEAKVYGNVVELAGFGRLTLGEMIIDRGTRRLTMLRYQLDPALGTNGDPAPHALSDNAPPLIAMDHGGGAQGEGECGSIGCNGHDYP